MLLNDNYMNTDEFDFEADDVNKDDVELLGNILGYSMNRDKSYKVAYELLKQYCGLSNVMSANKFELMLHRDINEPQMVLIKSMFEVYERINKGNMEKRRFKTFDSIGEMFVNEFKYIKSEVMIAVAFSKTGKIVRKMKFTSHDVDFAKVEYRQIALLASSCKSGFLAIAHNHPSGILVPSLDDRHVTSDVLRLLECLKVKFMDHYIVSGDKYVGILANEDKIRMK